MIINTKNERVAYNIIFQRPRKAENQDKIICEDHSGVDGMKDIFFK